MLEAAEPGGGGGGTARLNICVVGATFLDAMYRVPIEPRLGKTLYALEAKTMPGGKGLNQAIATALDLAANVSFITAIGTDGQGDAIVGYLKAERLDAPSPRRPITVLHRPLERTPTVAVLVAGEQHGMLAPPRPDHRERLRPRDIDEPERAQVIRDADVVLATLDFPDVIGRVVYHATHDEDGRPRGIAQRPLLILNAAPAVAPGDVALSDVREFDWIVPNVAEARALLGLASPSRGDARRAVDTDLAEAAELALALRDRFLASACVTASSQGCCWAPLYASGDADRESEAFSQEAFGALPADVTGASDAFCATLARSLAAAGRGERSLTAYAEAIRHAAAAGSLAVETLGSSHAMPTPAEVSRLIAQDDRARERRGY